ncbi:3537_t:CDS:2 [Entrophospora sp. SA101]|nr:3537_t:CDS:2 [Entrophospora sp. SA101]
MDIGRTQSVALWQLTCSIFKGAEGRRTPLSPARTNPAGYSVVVNISRCVLRPEHILALEPSCYLPGRYTDDIKNASMFISNYLRKNEFIEFDLTRSEDDPLAIRLRFDTPLDLQKEIGLRQKKKKKRTS